MQLVFEFLFDTLLLILGTSFDHAYIHIAYHGKGCKTATTTRKYSVYKTAILNGMFEQFKLFWTWTGIRYLLIAKTYMLNIHQGLYSR